MRVLVVDDHPLIQEAVSNVLRRLDAQVEIDCANHCQGGLDIAGEGNEPDLVLLDLNLPGLCGIPALKAWRASFPAIPVIVLSASADRRTILAAFDAGAAGFIPKSSSNEVMRDAVRLVLDGGKYLPPEALSAPGHVETVDHPRQDATSVQSLGLTQRQIDVLRLMASGASNKIICRELGLADRTVKAHITGVFRVLNVSSRTQAVLAASRIGLIGKAQGDGRSGEP